MAIFGAGNMEVVDKLIEYARNARPTTIRRDEVGLGRTVYTHSNTGTHGLCVHTATIWLLVAYNE